MKKNKPDWLAAVDDVEKRMLAGRAPSRSTLRVALIEAYTAGKFSMVKAAPRAKKRRAS